jgi:hypothetical protein
VAALKEGRLFLDNFLKRTKTLYKLAELSRQSILQLLKMLQRVSSIICPALLSFIFSFR